MARRTIDTAPGNVAAASPLGSPVNRRFGSERKFNQEPKFLAESPMFVSERKYASEKAEVVVDDTSVGEANAEAGTVQTSLVSHANAAPEGSGSKDMTSHSTNASEVRELGVGPGPEAVAPSGTNAQELISAASVVEPETGTGGALSLIHI